MPTRNYVLLYIITFGVFLLIDFLWIYFFINDFYQSQVGFLLGDTQLLPALLFYISFVAGLLLFAIRPALENYALHYAILYGGLLGMIAYGAYGLTNLSIIENWSVFVTVSDIVWGAILGGVVSGISYTFGSKLWL